MAKVSKKTWMWILIALAVIVIALVIIYFSTKKKFSKLSDVVNHVKKPKDPVPAGAHVKNWIPESFPLDIGMYGENIRLMQRALGINDDGKFGSQTFGAVTNQGVMTPVTESDYNTIIDKSTVGTSGTSSGSEVNAKYDITAIYLNDSPYNPTLLRYAKKNEDLGELTSQDDTYYYMKSNGDIKAKITESYLS